MKKLSAVVATSVMSVLAAGVIAAPAYAWTPTGKIVKEVQNQTTGSAKSDANDVATAVSTTNGDVIIYTITVSNVAAPAADGHNDMAGIVLTDTLPAGVELVSDPGRRTITENLGTLKPGDKVVKTYSLRVASNTDGDRVTNEACYSGDSLIKDHPQHGCDKAIILVKKQPTPPTPPTELPKTGSAGLTAAAVAFVAAVAGYGVNTLRVKIRRDV